MMRTNTCGELSKKDIGQEATLCGWIQSRRDHGGIIFVDLRDRYGLTQVVFDPNHNSDAHDLADSLRREFVVKAKGKVRSRAEGMVNSKLATGEIEMITDSLEILSKSETPPIEIEDGTTVNEDYRLKYRYMDLRRPEMQKRLMLRHKAAHAARSYLSNEKFLEIETPMLARSTPEGARDYLVPSRVHPGKFFALPQSPQLFKQLFMVSGLDRYFQIVKCFRDEDLRADRQPEFTQIDIEMSFITEEDVYSINEGLIKHVWKETKDVDIETPFPRMSYAEAMSSYGSDKPDIRFDLEMVDVGDIVKESDFSVIKSVLEKGGAAYCLNATGCAGFSRKELDEIIEVARIHGAKGLAYMKYNDQLESSIVKYFPEAVQNSLIERMGAKKGDLLLLVSDNKETTAQNALGQVRLHLGRKLELMDPEKNSFIWIVDFPLLEWNDDEKRFTAMHHPFTSPKAEDIPLLDKEPGKVRADAYDITLNGVELGGGSIRIHDSELQAKMFTILGISPEEQQVKFGFLLEAFKYGAPPHGGIAYGFDRLVALLAGVDSIREVIAFPKNKAAVSLVDDAPNVVDDQQLKECHISKLEKKSKSD
ncbi:MAG: aspartate--tRNA ligase [archaeon]